MYQSEWISKPMLYLFPHWNWLEGQTIDLWAYYNQADEVELFINGKSQGIRKKIPMNSSHDGSGILALNTEYHVGWRVTFEPGEVKAVSRKDGKTVCEQIIRTAGAPHHIRLTTDYAGKDLTFVNAEVVDKDGNLCPWSEEQIFFSVSGGAEIISTDNGCQTSMERFTSPNRKAFFGKCIAVVRGKGVLTARGIGLENGHINIK